MRSKSYCLATRPFISGLMYQNCPQKIILQPTIGGAIQDKLKSGHGTTIFETTSTAAAAKVKHAIIPYKCQTSSKLQHTDVLSAQCLNMLHLFGAYVLQVIYHVCKINSEMCCLLDVW